MKVCTISLANIPPAGGFHPVEVLLMGGLLVGGFHPVEVLLMGGSEFNDLVAKIATWGIWLKYFFWPFFGIGLGAFVHLETKIAMWEMGKFVLLLTDIDSGK